MACNSQTGQPARTVLLSSLRARLKTDDDLAWYFRAEERHGALQRRLDIHATLGMLPASARRVLACSYGPPPLSHELRAFFGATAGLVVRAREARGAFRADTKKLRARDTSVAAWLAGVILREDRDTLLRIRVAAEATLARAIAAYEKRADTEDGGHE